MTQWNAHQTWKFAWPQALDRYWCFGESAWGDQYAYLCDDRSGDDAPIYMLEGLAIVAERVGDNFESFLEAELLRSATQPYDSMVARVFSLLMRAGTWSTRRHRCWGGRSASKT